MKSLTDIANFYGTDKGTEGPSAVHGAHNYTDIYESYIGSFRDKAISILEIGIGLKRKDDPRIAHGRNKEGAASVHMWYEYLPKGDIHAVDIVPASQLDNERIHTYIADQGDKKSLEALIQSFGKREFDFIIDDGSHHPDHQQLTLNMLFPLLRSGGVYFIEDLRNDGLGDPGKNGIFNDRVLNTRRVLKSFNESSVFEAPNALGDTSYLAEHIAAMHFHVPVQRVNRKALIQRFIGGKEKVLEFVPNSELLCAIRKK